MNLEERKPARRFRQAGPRERTAGHSAQGGREPERAEALGLARRVGPPRARLRPSQTSWDEHDEKFTFK